MTRSSFDRIRPLLEQAVHSNLSHEATAELQVFRDSDVYAALPLTLEAALTSRDTALYALKLTADALHALSQGSEAEALALLKPALALPVEPEPLDGLHYQLGAALSTRMSDMDVLAFSERYERSKTYASGIQLARGLEAYLLDPHVAAVIDDFASPGTSQDHALPFFAKPAPYVPRTPLDTTLSPFSGEADDAPVRLKVQRLLDARIASFAVAGAELYDLTDANDEEVPGAADLVLALDPDGWGLLHGLDPTRLTLRLITHAEKVVMFSAEAGSLFDIEVLTDLGRLYFKLQLPASWHDMGVPTHLAWQELEVCVIISST